MIHGNISTFIIHINLAGNNKNISRSKTSSDECGLNYGSEWQ